MGRHSGPAGRGFKNWKQEEILVCTVGKHRGYKIQILKVSLLQDSWHLRGNLNLTSPGVVLGQVMPGVVLVQVIPGVVLSQVWF